MQPQQAGGQLSMVVIPQVVWEKVLSALDDLQHAKDMIVAGKPADEWIESNEARKKLGVCQKTWQTYRDRRLIPFSQFGRKIYVKRSDLNAFMENHYIAAK